MAGEIPAYLIRLYFFLQQMKFIIRIISAVVEFGDRFAEEKSLSKI